MISDYMLDPPDFDGEPPEDDEPIAACRYCNATGWRWIWVAEPGRATRKLPSRCENCKGTGHTLLTEDTYSDWVLTPAEAAPDEPIGFWD